MPSFLKNDVVLVRYPFSDLSAAKVRPAVVVNGPHVSEDFSPVEPCGLLGAISIGALDLIFQDRRRLFRATSNAFCRAAVRSLFPRLANSIV